LDQLDQQGHQDKLELLVIQDSKGIKEHRVLLDHVALLGLLVLRDPKETLGVRDRQDRMDSLET